MFYIGSMCSKSFLLSIFAVYAENEKKGFGKTEAYKKNEK